MTGKGHYKMAVVSSPIIAILTHSLTQSLLIPFLAFILYLSGSTAPDWLEIRLKSGKTILPHRGITHHAYIWALILTLSYLHMDESTTFLYSYVSENVGFFLFPACFGFAGGCLLHILGDLFNYQKMRIIPLFPKLSLNLWASGERESFILFITFLITVAFLFVHFFDFNLNYFNLF